MIEFLSSGLIHGRRAVSIGIKGDVDISVTQSLGNGLMVDTSTQHSRGAGVAGIMQADLGEVVFCEKALPLLRKRVWGIGLAVGLAHHKTFTIHRNTALEAMQLIGSVAIFQSIHDVSANGDGSFTGLGLGTFGYYLGIGLDAGFSNGDGAVLKVDMLPL